MQHPSRQRLDFCARQLRKNQSPVFGGRRGPTIATNLGSLNLTSVQARSRGRNIAAHLAETLCSGFTWLRSKSGIWTAWAPLCILNQLSSARLAGSLFDACGKWEPERRPAEPSQVLTTCGSVQDVLRVQPLERCRVSRHWACGGADSERGGLRDRGCRNCWYGAPGSALGLFLAKESLF